MNPDMINGLYEGFGALFVLATCRNLWKSKQPWGVSIVGICFFTSWGIWNLYYYPTYINGIPSLEEFVLYFPMHCMYTY